MFLSRLVWFVPLVAVALEGTALADAHTEAVVLFDQGMKDMKAGDYPKACKELAASLEKFNDSGTKGSLAICYGHLGKTASAWLLWRQLVDTSTAKDLRDDAAKRAAALEPKVPRFVVKLKGPTPGIVVEINGDKVDPSLGVAVPVDPGKLLVEAEAPGYTTWTGELTATEGQTTTIEIPALTKDKTGKGARPVGTGTASATFLGQVALAGSNEGAFTKDNQQDGYTLELAQKATLKLEVTHAGTKMGVDTVLFVYGPANGATFPTTTIFSDDDGGWGKLSKIPSATLAPGKYAIVVASKGSGRGNYRLTTTCVSGCPDGVEQVKPDDKKQHDKKTDIVIGGERYQDKLVEGRRSRRHLIALVIGGVGVAALGAGGYFGLQARSKFNEAKDACGGTIENCPTIQIPISQRHVDDARKAGNISTAFVIGGAVAVAAGVVVWVTAPKVEHRVTVAPVVGDGTTGFVLSGSF